MSANKKKLLTEAQAEKIRQTAETDPEAALRELRQRLAVRVGIARAKKFSIDAIGRTPKRRTPRMWTGSLDQEFSGDQDRASLVATGRDIFLNFSFARGLLRQHVKNMIGVGPRLQAMTDDDEFNKRAEDYWYRRKDLIDVRGMSFDAALRVGEQREVIDGDYGRMIVTNGQTQFIEADRIKDPPADKKVRGRKYVGGVEMSRDGIPIAYHIWNRGSRPGQMTYAKRVEALNFIHSFRPERFDQARGVSWVTAGLNDLQDLRETLEATKGKAKIENMLGVAIKSDMPESNEIASLWGGLTEFESTDMEGNDESRYEVKLGQGVHSFELRPGEDITTIESRTPNNTFEPFTLLLIRFIALTIDMPLEIALQYYTRGSYSAHRASFIQYYDATRQRRSEIEKITLDRLYGWVIYRAIKTGALKGPANSNTDPTIHLWQWPGMTLLDPDKERKADTLSYKLGVESLGDITARDGKFWQDVAMSRIKEIKWIVEQAEKNGVDPKYVLPAVSLPGETPPSSSDGEGGTE